MLSEQCNQVSQAVQVQCAHDGAEPTSAKASRRPRVIVVASGPEGLPPEVLERAEELRSALGFELKFLSAPPEAKGSEPLETLLLQVARPEVALVVLANPPLRLEGGKDARWHELLRRCQRPLLFVGARRSNPMIVAASDCADPELPVVREAGIIAVALRASLTLVHNIDSKASQLAQRIGYPLSKSLADLLAMRLREELEQAAVGSQVVITRDSANARAVLEVAQAQSADLLVIGVKPLDVVRSRTADAILDAANQSVLFIPLPSASKSLQLD